VGKKKKPKSETWTGRLDETGLFTATWERTYAIRLTESDLQALAGSCECEALKHALIPWGEPHRAGPWHKLAQKLRDALKEAS
jgi:hypothetical protein